MTTTARGRRTRQLIIERTSAVFDQRGFAAATLNQLVDSTGLTRGAFYFHFDSKDALAEAIATAQTERWPQLYAEVCREESDPIRRLLVLLYRAGSAFRDDTVIRAASRLMNERAVIRREMPLSTPFWAKTWRTCLQEAVAQGRLRDLSNLVQPDWPETSQEPRWVDWFSDHMMATTIGLTQAVSQAGWTDLPQRLRSQWRLMVAIICDDEHYRDDLNALIDQLTAEMSDGTLPPVMSPTDGREEA